MEAAERSLLRSTVETAIGDATASGATGSAIDDVLARLGWSEMLATEPRDAIEIVFGALGAHNAAASAIDDVFASAFSVEPPAEVAVVFPPFGGWDPPGHVDGGRVRVVGVATARAASARELLVACTAGSGLRAVRVAPAEADITTAHGIDPDGGLHMVRVDAPAADARALDPVAWDSAVASGRRAVARQIAGASRAMLELARTHAVERIQFGHPVAGFQAVRHRLAEALVAVEALEASVEAAWDEPSPQPAALAKAVAGRSTRTVAAHCQQVLAGVGFTTDHPFHRYLKRTMALEGLFGSADEIVLDLGRSLLADRHVPTLLEL